MTFIILYSFSNNTILSFQRHGSFVTEPISAQKVERIINNPSGWRVDSLVEKTSINAPSDPTVTTGILPGMGESTHRRTDIPNHKRRWV